MANAKNDIREQVLNQQKPAAPKAKNEAGKKQNDLVFGLIAVLTAVLIMAVVLGGVFYVAVHNNINGFAERYRTNIQKIPVLKYALPAAEDPEDPKNLTDAELRTRYNELRSRRDALLKEIDEANQKILELEKYRDEAAAAQAVMEKVAEEQQQTEQQRMQNEADRKAIEEMAANSDKSGFKQFYETMDKESAQKIYAEISAEILQEQKADADAKKFAQLYEAMDASAAARIFEEMGETKLELIVNIFENMKKEISAEILAAMDAKFASRVSEKLSEIYIKAKP